MSAPGEAVSQEKVGVWEDFVDIFHAPSEVFARRRGAGFWAPLLVVAVIATILAVATLRILEPAIDADADRQAQEMLRQNPDMDISGAEGMMDSLRGVFGWFAGLFVVVTIVVMGMLLWVGAKLAGSALDARSGILIATYAAIPRLAEGVLVVLEGLVRGPSNIESMSRLSWSAARFLDPDSASRLAIFLAGAPDLFTIWWLAILAIGLSVIGRIPRTHAAAVVAGVWVLISLPGLIGALMS
jgi:hypothetical protein